MNFPILGLVFHWTGGLASASFYLPYRGVRKWAWETYWLLGGIFSWIIVPWLMALTKTNDIFGVLGHATAQTLFWTYFFGLLWGLGGLTFGLTMRYLGISLGMAVALGYCAAFGTVIPPIFHGEFVSKVLGTTGGLWTLAGVGVCLVGIAVAGAAGMAKERNLPPELRQSVIKEFNFRKGLLVATFSGVMSSCFAFALDAGTPIKDLSGQAGTDPLWCGLAVLVVVLAGGFTTNFIWCLYLHAKNGTGGQYFGRGLAKARLASARLETAVEAPGEEMARQADLHPHTPAPMLTNYLFCALAGTLWYLQFFFYTMGQSKMEATGYSFASWTLHMASIIIFSSLWGLALKEWRGAGSRAMQLLSLALLLLVGSTVVVGYGTYLSSQTPPAVKTASNQPPPHPLT